jgi:hypothetical protein
MASGQSREQRLLQQLMEDQSLLFRDVRSDESDVELIGFYSFDQLCRVAFGQRQGDSRKGLAELADDTRHQWMERGRTRKSHRELALLTSRRAPRGFNRTIEIGERRTCAFKKGLTGIRQLNSASYTAEQLYPDFFLDCLDEAAERRLLKAKPLSRTGDVPFFRYGDNVTEVPELH